MKFLIALFILSVSQTSFSTEMEEVCKNEAKSKVRYYSWEYIYKDCISFSRQINTDQAVACSEATILAKSFLDCLHIVKGNDDILPEQIIEAGNLPESEFAFTYTLKKIAEYPLYLTADEIKKCGVRKKEVRECIVESYQDAFNN